MTTEGFSDLLNGHHNTLLEGLRASKAYTQGVFSSQELKITNLAQRVAELEGLLVEAQAQLAAIPDLDMIKSQEELESWRESLDEQDAQLQKEAERLESIKESKDLTKLRSRLQKRGEELREVRRDRRALDSELTQERVKILRLQDRYTRLEGELSATKKTLGLKIDGAGVNTNALNGIMALRELVDRIQKRGILLGEDEQGLYNRAAQIMQDILSPPVPQDPT